MRIVSACIYALKIPFVHSFCHSLASRNHSDSIVVKITDDSGISGFGEGVPRPYVTGETRDASVEVIRSVLLPRLMGAGLDGRDPGRALAEIDRILPEPDTRGDVVWHASRCAVELAAIDCLCRRKGVSVNEALPSNSPTVTYSGVITSGSLGRTREVAHRCKVAGLKHVKMKVCGAEDVVRVAAVRDLLGPSVSIRLDANAAFGPETAVPFLRSVEVYDIACIEQPVPRGDPAHLAAVRSSSPIPVMADESVVTFQDAKALIEHRAVDYFNLRLSKCGGIHRLLAIAALAAGAGVGIQLGCQVGETAILSSAGRHLAAHLSDVRFVEGSYGTHLLSEDVSEKGIMFGPAGRAPVLTGEGLGITVSEGLLDKYAEDKIFVCQA